VLVRVDADDSPWHSTIQVEAPNRPGLLYDLVRELAHRRVDVQLARINGDDGRAMDVFYVTDAAGSPLSRAAAGRLCTVLAGAIAQR
jgi:[protein-PII] uridylyltransferase